MILNLTKPKTFLPHKEKKEGKKLNMEERKQEGVMRITSAGKERNYIGYAMGLFLEKGASALLLASFPRALHA